MGTGGRLTLIRYLIDKSDAYFIIYEKNYSVGYFCWESVGLRGGLNYLLGVNLINNRKTSEVSFTVTGFAEFLRVHL